MHEVNEPLNVVSMKNLLIRGHRQGLWSVEHLDRQSPGWEANERTWKKHPMYRMGNLKVHRNLLRQALASGQLMTEDAASATTADSEES